MRARHDARRAGRDRPPARENRLGLTPRLVGARESLPFGSGRATMCWFVLAAHERPRRALRRVVGKFPNPTEWSTHPRRRRVRRGAVTRKLAERVVAWRWYIIAGWIVVGAVLVS